MKRDCIVITGPTAVGKTSLSLKLAGRLNGSIISADCIQVYKGLDIGSSKLPGTERMGIPHYLIDVLDPSDRSDVTLFCEMARSAMEEIYAEGRLPVIVGGTGFYIQALLKDVDFDDRAGSGSLRDELFEFAEKNGSRALHDRLRSIDPESADAIHENNVRRVVRAIEFYELTGRPISEHNKEQRSNEPAYRFALFVINDDRQVLYERINKRVDEMMNEGLLQEVTALKNAGLTSDNTSMKGIGYSEILEYLNGGCTLEEAVEKIKTNTRHYAKRQLTWFRREKDTIWVDRTAFGGDEDKMTEYMISEWNRIKNENT